MTWFDSTVLYANDEYVNGRPPVLQTGSWRFESSLVDWAVEVVDTPGCAPEEAGHPIALRGIWDQRGFIRLACGFDSRSRDQWAGGATR
jgi:hypothetical protein